MPTYEVPAQPCPHCGRLHELATSTNRNPLKKAARPKAGDITICVECAQWAVFDDDGTLRQPTPAELTGIKSSFEAFQVEQALAQTKLMAARAGRIWPDTSGDEARKRATLS